VDIYYISLPNHFKTGVKNGIWAHLLTNKSYQVFYGKKYPFEVEFPSVNKFNNKYFQSLSYKLIARRYTNDVDYHVNNQIGFDTVMIYNDTQSSGLGKIIKETKNDMFQACRQPKFNKDSFNIVATSTDGFWSLNNFWNNVKDECNGIPIFKHDCNEIEKIPNQKAMNFEPTWKDRLRGDWFLIRLSYIKDTRYKIIFKWANIKATYYA
jgi:hypothetical protein